jgi:hypothetical protein
MRIWFMVAAVSLGIIGWWGQEGRSERVAHGSGVTSGQVSTMEDPNPIPSPRPR